MISLPPEDGNRGKSGIHYIFGQRCAIFKIMKIGSLRLRNNLILAPLSEIGDAPFMKMAARWGAGMVTSEMISAHGLARGDDKTMEMLQHDPPCCPFSAQIFGAQPEIMAEAARRVEASGAHAVDINMGCPVKKVTRIGAGAALMREPLKAESIVRAVRRAVSIPVTVKIRSGWDQFHLNAVEVSQRAVAQGADAITVHPRTRAQGFSGDADWPCVTRIVKAISIPVIGNGGVFSPEDATSILRETGCHGIMIGRGALGRPWIFRQVEQYLRGEPVSDSPGGEGLLREILDHLHWAAQQRRPSLSRMRRHIAWYTRGLPHVSMLRKNLHLSADLASMEQSLVLYFLTIKGSQWNISQNNLDSVRCN
jgi:tRNA-dihydrouridine synthase B